MKQPKTTKPDIVPRPLKDLSLGLDEEIPKYWFGGDAFQSRLFDAMSTLFPDGERFFIACVRDYRDQITDEKLKQEVSDFIRQEAQHGAAHDVFNKRVEGQGVDIPAIENGLKMRLKPSQKISVT